MNKKLAFGFAALCATSAFVACGDGSIVSTDSSDKLAKASAQTDLTELDTNDIRTYMSMAGIPTDENTFGSATSAPTSSAAVPTSSAPAATSSASTPLGGLSSPSGSLTGPTGGLSAAAPESSSAGAVDPIVTPGDASKGSCKPSKPAVELNEAVTWTYEPPEGTAVSVLMGLAAKDFRWTFTDGTPDAVAKKGMTSDPVAYAKSGEKTATVFFDYLTGVEESVSCKVNVKGIPVTGCKCTATAAEVDLAGKTSIEGSWTVDPATCVSEDTQFTYTWTGATGAGNTATASFTEKKQTITPTVRVTNSDNGFIDVPCDAVMAVDSESPDYVLDGTEAGSYVVEPGTYSMVYSCKTDQYYQTPVMAVAPNGAVEVEVGGTPFSITQYGQEKIYSSQNAGESITIKVISGNPQIKCQ